MDLDKLFMDVAVYNQRVMGPAHVRAVTDLACRQALGRRGVAHLTFPVDLQDEPYQEREHSKMKVPGCTAATRAATIQAPPAESDRAAEILNRGRKVAILAGRGALDAADELESLADTLAAPGEVGAVLDRALAQPGPVVVKAVVDPLEPPMPARIKPEQALNMAQSLARGEPNRGRIAATLFRDKVTDFLAPSPAAPGPVETIKEKLREVVKGDGE